MQQTPKMTPGTTYPQITFWNKGSQKMTIVNPDDFRRDDLLKKLGIESSPLRVSFGVTDSEEILRRQRIVRFMVNNPRFTKLLANINPNSLLIPIDGQEFIDYFSRRKSPFWQAAKLMSDIVRRASDVPVEVSEMITYLGRIERALKSKETSMYEEISKQIQKSTFVQGQVEVHLRNKHDSTPDEVIGEADVYGFKKFSFRLSSKFSQAGVKFNEKLEKLQQVVESILVWLKKGLLYSPLVIAKLPYQIKRDLETYFKDVSRFKKPHYRCSDNSLSVSVAIRYCESGLWVRISKISIKPSIDVPGLAMLADADFPGYGRKELSDFRKYAEEIQTRTSTGYSQHDEQRIAEALELGYPGITSGYTWIPSPESDKELKWFSVGALVKEPRFAAVFDEIQGGRSWFKKLVIDLREIAVLADAFRSLSKKWGIPLTFPNIYGDERHLVDSSRLYPIHLLGRGGLTDKKGREKTIEPRDLVALEALPPLNGQMLGLTGANAGGKTAALEAFANAIYLAQSGLPVFAESFGLNVKDVLGIMFIERGPSSTADLLVRKMQNILERIKDMDKKKIVLLFDEVGSATEEGGVDEVTGALSGGYGLGVRLFKTVARHGCSVIFTTQIRSLAEYAARELGAICYQFDLSHNVSEGIGNSDIENLVKRSGLEELLVE